MQVVITADDLAPTAELQYDHLVDEYGEEAVEDALRQAAAEAARQQVAAYMEQWIDNREQIETRLVQRGVLDAENAVDVSE